MLDRHIQRRIEVRRMPTDQAFAGPYLTSEAKLLRSASANLGCPSSVIAHSVPALEREDKFRGRRAGPACYKAASRLRPGGAPEFKDSAEEIQHRPHRFSATPNMEILVGPMMRWQV